MFSIEKKVFFLGLLLAIFQISYSAAAADDILEEISESLEKPAAASSWEQESHWVSLYKAMTRKDSYILYKELYLSGRYSSVLDRIEGRNSLGLILFGTYSGPKGQLGDLNVQLRIAYYSNQFAYGEEMPREYTEDINDFELELHNAYLRLRAWPPLFNFRIGHFYVPYGLQPWIDTHGTLLQGPTMEFTGLDRDWGIGFEGQNETLEYQAGLMRGSGMEYFQRENNYALAGKVSTPRIGEHLNEWLGVSVLSGRIFDPMAVEKLHSVDMEEKEDKFAGNILNKQRVGIDGQKIIGPAQVRGEISTGRDALSENILAEFAEAKYALGKSGRWTSYLQYENFTQDIERYNPRSNTTLRSGLTYNFSANYNLQFVISHDLATIFGEKDTWLGILFYSQKGGGLFTW